MKKFVAMGREKGDACILEMADKMVSRRMVGSMGMRWGGVGPGLERPIDRKRTQGCREGTLFLLFLFSSDSLCLRAEQGP